MQYTNMAIFLTLIMISSSLSGCIDNSTDNNVEERVVVHYEVNIISNNTTEEIVYLPVPLSSSYVNYKNPNQDRPIKLMDELSVVNGTGNYSVINTTFGYALEIRFNKSLHIIGHKEIKINSPNDFKNDYVFRNISMAITDRYDSSNRIHSNGTPVIQFFSTYYSAEARYYEDGEDRIAYSKLDWGLENYTLGEGWQTVNIFIMFHEVF